MEPRRIIESTNKVKKSQVTVFTVLAAPSPPHPLLGPLEVTPKSGYLKIYQNPFIHLVERRSE